MCSRPTSFLFLALTLSPLISTQAYAVSFLQSYQSALIKNENIAEGNENVTQAREQLRQARGAVMPNVSLNASKTWQDRPADPFAKEFSPATQEAASIQVKQPLFSGLREVWGYEGKKRVLESTEQQAVVNQVKLYIDVGTAYFNILSYEQDLKNLGEQVDIYDGQVKDLRSRTKRGDSSVTELLTAEASQASLQAEMQLVAGQLATTRQTYAYLTGLAADSKLDDEAMKGPQLQHPLLKMDEYLARVEQRPDIRSANKMLEANEDNVRFAKGGHWPTIDATGNYYLKRPIVFLEDVKWDATINFSLPIFQGGAQQAQVREAASKRSTAQLELARLRRQASQDIHSYYESLKIRLNQVAALEKSVGLAEKNYKQLERDVRHGLVRSIDADVALTNFRVARRTFDQARYAAQIDLIGLEASSFMVPILTERSTR